LPDKITIEDGTVRNRYVAYCDVLGFSAAVTSDFSEASKVYVDFINQVRTMETIGPAQVTVYSDSILVAADDLAPVLSTVKILWWAALFNDWLIRGGVAYCRVWQYGNGNSLFVVSEPLIKAVQIEKATRVPAVQISPDLEIPESLWVTRFARSPLSTSVLHFGGMNIVNPFNPFWFQSACTRVAQLLERYPHHSDKYYWFLALAEQVQNSAAALVPAEVLSSLQARGIVKFVPTGPATEG